MVYARASKVLKDAAPNVYISKVFDPTPIVHPLQDALVNYVFQRPSYQDFDQILSAYFKGAVMNLIPSQLFWY